MEYIVEGTLEWAALTEADLPQLAELRTAIEYFDDPVERQDLAQLSESWSFPGGDPGFNCTVGRDKGGTIVAYGWNHVRGLEIGCGCFGVVGEEKISRPGATSRSGGG